MDQKKIKDHDINYYEYSEFSETRETIGRGGFGIIEKAVINDDDTQKVALKRIISGNDSAEFVRELKLLRMASHPNVNRFLGITKAEGKYIMVLEYADGGNLEDYLKNLKNKEKFDSLKWKDKIRMALDITRGLKHLHSKNIIHRDLHPKNILVKNKRLQIADLGISKKLDAWNNGNTNSKLIGRAQYIDPRCIYKNHPRDYMSDLYSLGILLWEISSGEPFNVYSSKKKEIKDTPKEYRELYERCWNDDPKLRPDVNEIDETLTRISNIDVNNNEQHEYLSEVRRN